MGEGTEDSDCEGEEWDNVTQFGFDRWWGSFVRWPYKIPTVRRGPSTPSSLRLASAAKHGRRGS